MLESICMATNMEKELLNSVIQKLSKYHPISLKRMDQVALMNRVDTKFVLRSDYLTSLLDTLMDNYYVLEVGNKRYTDYKSDYFDTSDYQLFLKHHNNNLNRHKVRYREYRGSELSFLEVKFKNNKGRTIKNRIQSWVKYEVFDVSDSSFLSKSTPLAAKDLKYSLTNNFTRVTLVNKTAKERVTIDFSLVYSGNKKTKMLNNVTIVELKQEKLNRNSPIFLGLSKYQVKPSSFSKYCIGIVLLKDNIKYNRFKSTLLKLKAY